MKARDFGIPFEGRCGKYNAITDVSGVEVGFRTIIRGESTEDTTKDSDFARTGVTCILPRGKRRSSVFAGRAVLNGNGEMTGTHWVDDSGFLHGPVMITNTNSVGIVRDTTAKWMVDNDYFPPAFKDGKEVPGLGFFYPVVGETFDGTLNNINGFKVTPEDVLAALDSAAGGPVQEGCVGGGTGVAAMHHIAKGHHDAGNYVIACIGARNKDLLLFEKELSLFCDEVLVSTDDGSEGRKGIVTDLVRDRLDSEGGNIAEVVAVGPVPMMQAVADLTRGYNVPTTVSLNSLMVDGLGMCGACRVTVGGEMKFTCVDGPEFDGHQVDFAELRSRLGSFRTQEAQAREHHRCNCFEKKEA